MDMTNKPVFKDRLKRALYINNMRQQELAQKTLIPKASISQYLKGKAHPKSQRVYLIAKALNVSEAWLLGYDVDNMEHKNNTSTYEFNAHSFIDKYNSLDTHGRKIVDYIVNEEFERMLNTSDFIKAENFKYMPFYENYFSAGLGALNDNLSYDMVKVPINNITKRSDFIAVVSGDSMEPKFHNKDKIYIESTPAIDIGEIGAFVINDEFFIKKLGHNKLVSLNNEYTDIELDQHDYIRCIGRVLGKYKNLEEF